MEKHIKEIITQHGLDRCYNWNSVKNSEKTSSDTIFIGWISEYKYSKGWGVINDLLNNQTHFFHFTSIGEELYNISDKEEFEDIQSKILGQLKFDYSNSNEFKRIRSKLLDINSSYEILKSYPIGRVRFSISKTKSLPEVLSSQLNDVPSIGIGKIVCFKIKDGNAIEIHEPIYYKHELLENRNFYSENVWNLLYHFMDDIYTYYEVLGIEECEKKYESSYSEIKSIARKINNFDIYPYIKAFEDTEIRFKIEGSSATTRDRDPYTLHIDCNNPLTDDSFAHYHFSHFSQFTIWQYGDATLNDFIFSLPEPYASPFQALLAEREKNVSIREVNIPWYGISNINVYPPIENLIDKHFSDLKRTWIEEAIESYSKDIHLISSLNDIKRRILNLVQIKLKKVDKKVESNQSIRFDFDESLPYYGNRIEIKFSYDKYEITTFDESYKGYYKGKHFITKQQLFRRSDKNKELLTQSHINQINFEIQEFLTKKYNELEEYALSLLKE